MSGIVGIFNRDGAPVDRDLLQKMTESMTCRGPDAQNIWTDGHVGFGHVMLRTTPESQGERQPFSLDGRVWITADARVDGRVDLVQKLESKGLGNLSAVTDVELVLHAYQLWGEDCVKHLIGDFAFAIWDGRRKSLFCARDHFGVKPFYYVQTAAHVLFASDIASLHKHPDVSSTLNELAVGDFLIFGGNQDETTTIFEKICRLPPAHHLVVTGDRIQLNRYWMLPADGCIRYQDGADYIAQYGKIFRMAVEDRLRTNRVAVMMSGGTDSTAVAAVACQTLHQNHGSADVRAYTVVINDLLPGDQEGYFAGLTAQALGIPIEYLNAGKYRLYERWNEQNLRCQQPINHPMLASWFDSYFLCAKHSPVVLTGYGGDAIMGGSISYYTELLRRGRILQFLVSAGRHVHKYHSLRGLGFRSALKRLLGLNASWIDYPTWINPQFETRLNLRARFAYHIREVTPQHDNHPEAYSVLTAPLWTEIFEIDSPTSIPIEVRHPFFDVRLITFLLSIPQVPWCRNKTIHRDAMRDLLPVAVRSRSKAPLAGDRVHARLNHPTAPDVIDTSLTAVGENYVDRANYQYALEQFKKGDLRGHFYITAPVNLEYWMKTQIGSCN